MDKMMVLVYLEELVDDKTFSFHSLLPLIHLSDIEGWKAKTIEVCLGVMLVGEDVE